MDEIDRVYNELYQFGLPLGITGSFATNRYNSNSDIDVFMVGDRDQVIRLITNKRFRDILNEYVVNDDVLRRIANGEFNVFCAKGQNGREINVEVYTLDLLERMRRFEQYWITRFRTRVTGKYKMMPYKSVDGDVVYSPIFHYPRFGAFDTKLLSLIKLNDNIYVSLHYDKLMKAVMLIDDSVVSNMIGDIKDRIKKSTVQNWIEIFYRKGVDDYENNRG